MRWFQAKEQSAGKKRLILSWYIYLLFGRHAVYFIAFIVSFFTLIFSKQVNLYSKKYLTIISQYTKITPSFINRLKHVNSYACSLVDKMIMYAGKFNSEDIIFENEEEKKKLFADIKNGKGVLFIFAHIGNIEVLQAFFQKQKFFPGLGINVFLNKKQTKIFNEFIDVIKKPMPVKYIITEDFDISGVIKLKENLDNGEVVFIAGDRLSENYYSKNITKIMFNRKINLPKGSFQLAKILETPVYFISAIKQKNNKYVIYIKKNEEKDIAENYVNFMEKMTINNPLQFYHFYDFFLN